MKPTLLAVRAIGAAYAKRLWMYALIVAGIASILLIGLVVWLSHSSGWWWLLGVPVGIAVSVGVALLAITRYVISYVSPAQSSATRKQVGKFVNKLQELSELVQTPKITLLFRIVRSIAAPSSEKYLENLMQTRELKADFSKLVDEFRD